jgi:universal stress protein E
VAAAACLAALDQGSVTLLHAWRPVGELSVMSHATDEEFTAFLEADRRAAASRLERMKQLSERPSAVRVELRHGTPELVIPEFIVAEGADTLVIGSVGRTWVSGLLRGNTVERILAALPCSVLVVKPRRFAPPVLVDVPA